MKALTLHQPWATLAIIGAKPWETRSWRTDHRGPLAIHSSLKLDEAGRQLWSRHDVATRIGRHWLPFDQLPRGCVLGEVKLVWCEPAPEALPTVRQIWLAEDFGDFSPGRFAWSLAAPEKFAQPIPARGYQRLWNWFPGSPSVLSVPSVVKNS